MSEHAEQRSKPESDNRLIGACRALEDTVTILIADRKHDDVPKTDKVVRRRRAAWARYKRLTAAIVAIPAGGEKDQLGKAAAIKAVASLLGEPEPDDLMFRLAVSLANDKLRWRH